MVALVLRETLGTVAGGLAIGIWGAVVLRRANASLLFAAALTIGRWQQWRFGTLIAVAVAAAIARPAGPPMPIRFSRYERSEIGKSGRRPGLAHRKTCSSEFVKRAPPRVVEFLVPLEVGPYNALHLRQIVGVRANNLREQRFIALLLL